MLNRPASRQEVNNENDECDYQQQVDQSTSDVCNEAE